MDKAQEEAACALLTRNWRQGTRIDALPPDLRPQDRASGYRIQAWLERFSPHPLFGWKIAATSRAGQAHIGVDGPLAGRLLQERGVPDGGSCPLGDTLMRVAELEFAFRMAVDVAPRGRPWTQDEVMAQVASLHPAIELPDSRFEMFETAGMAQLIADNACAHRFVIGRAADIDWRKLTWPPIRCAPCAMARRRRRAWAPMCWAIRALR
jgi:2-keto-4-pentenoate hydratase